MKMKKSNLENLKEELLKEILNNAPQEVLESLEDNLKQALEYRKSKELSKEEEFELIDKMESTIISFIMNQGEDLSVNGIMLLMFKILIGIEGALKDILSEEEFNHYKENVRKAEILRQQRENDILRMMKENNSQFLGEMLNKFKGDFK